MTLYLIYQIKHIFLCYVNCIIVIMPLEVSYVKRCHVPLGVALMMTVSGHQLDIVILAKDKLRNQTTAGLFGVYNGNPDDDFTLPDGTVLDRNSTREYIHYNFGDMCKYTHIVSTVCNIILRLRNIISYTLSWTKVLSQQCCVARTFTTKVSHTILIILHC